MNMHARMMRPQVLLEELLPHADTETAAMDEPVCVFAEVGIVAPRGRFDIEMHLGYLQLGGQVRIGGGGDGPGGVGGWVGCGAGRRWSKEGWVGCSWGGKVVVVVGRTGRGGGRTERRAEVCR